MVSASRQPLGFLGPVRPGEDLGQPVEGVVSVGVAEPAVVHGPEGGPEVFLGVGVPLFLERALAGVPVAVHGASPVRRECAGDPPIPEV